VVDKREINEARVVAHEVLRLLEEVERQLKGARNWGIYDMLGGGFFSSLIKHGKIDKADVLLRQVRAKLVQLQKELGDVRLGIDPRMNFTGFDRFMDIAFDNIISDWMVQSKIQNSRRDVAFVTAEVQRVISTLDRIEREYGTDGG
jgi:hypothetical protein